MKRALAFLLLIAAVVALVAIGPFGSSDNSYLVRGYFDNGGFIVSGEQVRIAGATVGSIDSVDVSMPGEAVHANGNDDPGKAVVVMKITDPAFADFRTDASCIIRPQSLLGEKYIDCSPTQPRAPGTAAPPALKVIPDGQPGAGESFLPLENNGKQVDLDIVQNTLRLPYAQRFRLILNDLGAGLAARGQDLRAIVRRADPALRETDQVLGILAAQNKQLAQLASDSDTILAPLARERQHVTGFIRSAGQTAAASAERGADLQAGLQKFPRFLQQLRTTMISLRGFSDQAQPVFATLGAAAPSLTRVTRELRPFSAAATVAFKSLGNAAEASTPDLVTSDSVVKQLRNLSRQASRPSKNLNALLSSLNTTGGFKSLLNFVYNGAGTVNGFDQYGHITRSEVVSSNCVDYNITPLSGCISNFTVSAKAKAALKKAQKHHGGKRPKAGQSGASLRGARDLLNFLIGPAANGNDSAGSDPASGSARGAPGSGSDPSVDAGPAYQLGPDDRGIGK